jgi:hypothetical protein
MTPSISCWYFDGVAQVYAIGRLHPQQITSDHVRRPAILTLAQFLEFTEMVSY